MFCNNCGQQNPDNASSCSQCGSPISMLFPAQASGTGAAAVAPAIDPTVTSPVPTAIPPAVAPPPVEPVILPPGEPKTDGKAVGSLILGILGLLTAVIFIGILLGIVAVILGHISRSAIKKSAGRLKGAGMALAGLIMGYISAASILFLPFILIVAAIAIPNLLKSRMAANEASAVASVRTVDTAVITYQTKNNAYPSDLTQLEKEGLIDATLAGGINSGYRFSYSASADRFFVVATPVKQGNTGTRSFCSGEDLIVRYTQGQECTAESTPLQ